jgi:hypothetical protein
MDSDRVAGIRAKLDRADEHLTELVEEVGAYFDSQPHSYPTEVDLGAGTFIVRIRINESPPSRLAIICGDFIQNLRAALDHLANGLVAKPTRRTQFPIVSDPDDFMCQVTLPARRNQRGPLTGLDPDGGIFAQIERLQPYHHSDEGPGSHPLLALVQLSNTDKHRTILTAASGHRIDPSGAHPDISFEGSDIEFTGEAVYTYDKVLADGDEVLRGDLEVTGPNPEPRISGDLITDLAFGSDAGFGRDRPITTDGLATTRSAVRSICDTLISLAGDPSGSPSGDPSDA